MDPLGRTPCGINSNDAGERDGGIDKLWITKDAIT